MCLCDHCHRTPLAGIFSPEALIIGVSKLIDMEKRLESGLSVEDMMSESLRAIPATPSPSYAPNKYGSDKRKFIHTFKMI